MSEKGSKTMRDGTDPLCGGHDGIADLVEFNVRGREE
jgi:hypothetical protein